MIADPACPVCNARSWREIGRRTYALADMPRLSDYDRRRYRVLFEVWLPGEKSVTLRSLLCGDCGFVSSTPRPTAAEIDGKYRFLGELDQDAPSLAPDAPIERRRGSDLYRHATRHMSDNSAMSILDYGGGDGRLMRDFVTAGHRCNLIDYRPVPVAGVTRLGATEADLAADARFDLIVCSHVIEHVAEPRTVVGRLAAHLSPGGMIYIEVPMEIWGRAPLHAEPVTHVNFFTPASCRRLMAECGLSTLSCRMGRYYNETGRALLAIRAIGRLAVGTTVDVQDGGEAETMRYLRPDATLKLKRYAWVPDRLTDRVKRVVVGDRT